MTKILTHEELDKHIDKILLSHSYRFMTMKKALEAFESIMEQSDINDAHIIAKNARYALREIIEPQLCNKVWMTKDELKKLYPLD